QRRELLPVQAADVVDHDQRQWRAGEGPDELAVFAVEAGQGEVRDAITGSKRWSGVHDRADFSQSLSSRSGKRIVDGIQDPLAECPGATAEQARATARSDRCRAGPDEHVVSEHAEQ